MEPETWLRGDWLWQPAWGMRPFLTRIDDFGGRLMMRGLTTASSVGPSSPHGPRIQRRSFSSPCLQVLGSPVKQACTAYGRLVRHAQRSAERQHALRRMQAPLRPELCGSAAGDVRFELAKALLRLVMERCCRLRSVSRAKSSQPASKRTCKHSLVLVCQRVLEAAPLAFAKSAPLE